MTLIDENSAMAAKALSPVAKALIGKLSIGRLYDPIDARRMNKAKSKNRIEDAKTDLEVARIKAEERIINEQCNIDEIVQKVVAILPSNAKPEELDQNWVNAARDKMKNVEDEGMQNLWAKIVAGEAESPGNFSYRVLEEVSQLSKEEAEAFTELAGYVWFCAKNQSYYLIADNAKHIWEPVANAINNTNLIDNYIGGKIRSFNHPSCLGMIVGMSYFSRECVLKLNKSGVAFSKVPVALTKVGRVLLPLCGSRPVPGEYEKVIERWKSDDQFNVMSPTEATSAHS